ncbi:hypothetical protein GCM10010393_00970 [Streptomyces gobitricini]|uniref:Uncharacterized protein n=1 Tax=Streptomyces gobitricini TaxID=68211 RepID=A0ABP5Y4Z1_9ACTN
MALMDGIGVAAAAGAVSGEAVSSRPPERTTVAVRRTAVFIDIKTKRSEFESQLRRKRLSLAGRKSGAQDKTPERAGRMYRNPGSVRKNGTCGAGHVKRLAWCGS